jgi:hypothetical protein
MTDKVLNLTAWHTSNSLFDFPDIHVAATQRMRLNRVGNRGGLGLWLYPELTDGRARDSAFVYRVRLEFCQSAARSITDSNLRAISRRFSFDEEYMDWSCSLARAGMKVVRVLSATSKVQSIFITDLAAIKTFELVLN